MGLFEAGPEGVELVEVVAGGDLVEDLVEFGGETGVELAGGAEVVHEDAELIFALRYGAERVQQRVDAVEDLRRLRCGQTGLFGGVLRAIA